MQPAVGVAQSKSNNASSEQLSRAHTENKVFCYRAKPQLTRSKTATYEPDQIPFSPEAPHVEEEGEIRHGWEDQYNSSEFLGHLSSVRFKMFAVF